MKTLFKSMLAAGVLVAATTATAAPVINVNWSSSAEAEFLATLSGPTVTENFNGLGGNPSYDHPQNQFKWENRSSVFETAVGTFELVTPGFAGATNPHADQLMIESRRTGESGREVLAAPGDLTDFWLDSNDAERVTWTLGSPLSGYFNAFGFWLADPADVRGNLTLTFANGETSSTVIEFNSSNASKLAYVSLVSDVNIVGGVFTFHQGSNNDGWGIDDVTVGYVAVPEPGTLLLMGLGLLGLGAARRRKTV